MYKPQNFTIEELVHPQIINDIGEANAWRRLNEFALNDLQRIRGKWFAKHSTGIYVNRPELGIDSRGLRPPDDPDGSFYSTHKKGTTFDLEPVNGLFRDLYDFIMGMIENDELEFLNILEDFEFTKTWIHVGYMNTDKKPLIIKP
ncbi:MAG: hypothetical protein GKR88_09450 [Flavobacteriaceae bacterium]|nr:MAG: hypothetical protein GKR88_09450 [Flavobacteriaceae bacterium]